MNAIEAANQTVPLLSSVTKFSIGDQTMPMLVSTDHRPPVSTIIDHLGFSRHLTNNSFPYLFVNAERTFASQRNQDHSSLLEATLTKAFASQPAASIFERQQNSQCCAQTLTLPTTPISSLSVIPSFVSLLESTDHLNMKTCYRCEYCGMVDQDKNALHLHMVREHCCMINAPLHSNIYSLPHQFRSNGGILDRFNMEASRFGRQDIHLGAPQADLSALTSSFLRAPVDGLYQKKAKCASTSSDSVVSPFLPDMVRCELCGKYLSRIKPLSSLLNHAKRHNALKQFICTECPYGSSEAAHVRNHMKLRHRIMGRVPLDNRNPTLQDAWMRITVRCFPTMSTELARFRFKNFRKKIQSGGSTVISKTTKDDESCFRSFLAGQ